MTNKYTEQLLELASNHVKDDQYISADFLGLEINNVLFSGFFLNDFIDDVIASTVYRGQEYLHMKVILCILLATFSDSEIEEFRAIYL